MFRTIDFVIIILIIIIAFTYIVNFNENFNQLICTSTNSELNSNTAFFRKRDEYCNPPDNQELIKTKDTTLSTIIKTNDEEFNQGIDNYKDKAILMIQHLKSMSGYTHVEIRNNPFRKCEILIQYLDTTLRDRMLSIKNNLKIILEKESLTRNYNVFIQNLNQIMLEIDNNYDYSFQDYNLDQIIQYIENDKDNSIYDESVITFLQNIKNSYFNDYEPVSYNISKERYREVSNKNTKLNLEFQKVLFGIITNGNNNITFGANTPVFYLLTDLLLKGYTIYRNNSSNFLFFKQTYSSFLNEVENYDNQIEVLKNDILNKISNADNQLTKNNNLRFMIFNVLKLVDTTPVDNTSYENNINYLKQLYNSDNEIHSEFHNFENLDNNSKMKYIKITQENLFDLHVIHSFKTIDWTTYSTKKNEASSLDLSINKSVDESKFYILRAQLIQIFENYFNSITDIYSDYIVLDKRLSYDEFNGSLKQILDNSINGSLYYLFLTFGLNLNPINQNTDIDPARKEELKYFYKSLFYIYLEVNQGSTNYFDDFLNYSSTLELLHSQQKYMNYNDKINTITRSNYTYEDIEQNTEILEIIEEKIDDIFNSGKSLFHSKEAMNSPSNYGGGRERVYGGEYIVINFENLTPHINYDYDDQDGTIQTDTISNFQGRLNTEYEGIYKGLDINSNSSSRNSSVVQNIHDFLGRNDNLENIHNRYLASPRLISLNRPINILNSPIELPDERYYNVGLILFMLLIINLFYGTDEEDPAYNFSIKEIACFNGYGVFKHILQGIKNLNLSIIYQGTPLESVSGAVENLKDDIVSVANILLDTLCNSKINNDSQLIPRDSERTNRINEGICNMRDEFSNLTYFNNSPSKYQNCD